MVPQKNPFVYRFFTFAGLLMVMLVSFTVFLIFAPRLIPADRPAVNPDFDLRQLSRGGLWRANTARILQPFDVEFAAFFTSAVFALNMMFAVLITHRREKRRKPALLLDIKQPSLDWPHAQPNKELPR
ncbi:MAG TPA: hypothetical protein VLS48_04360 [Anaerolineales bacterium]|nr:hypothetical protein [Anaerolineales bacterium]